MTYLSDNFTLEEFTKSETALKKGYSEQYNPSEEVKANLKLLAVNAAEPIRIKYGAFVPTVGFRCKRVNSDPNVKGAKDSEHLFGCAFDETFIKNGKNISREVFDWIIAGGLKKWSKVILEFPDENGIPRWLHIGYDPKNLNKQVLVAYKNALNQTKYINYYGSKFEKK